MSTLDNATDSQIDLARKIIMIRASITALDNDFVPIYNEYIAQRTEMQAGVAELIKRLGTEFGIAPENLIGLTLTPETIPAFLESEKPRGRRKKANEERSNVIPLRKSTAGELAADLPGDEDSPELLLPQSSSEPFPLLHESPEHGVDGDSNLDAPAPVETH